MERRQLFPSPTRQARVSIDTTWLDEYLSRIDVDHIDLIKFDIEGTEVQAL